MARENSNSPPEPPASERLDSWKEIAAYLKRDPRTVQRWEKKEDLPVHRHLHDKLGSVYAYRSELDAWWRQRRATLEAEPAEEFEEELPEEEQPPPAPVRRGTSLSAKVILVAVVAAAAVYFLWPLLRPKTQKIVLAVLPFANLTGDPEQDYFSDGLTEEIISQLGRLQPERLGVIARTTIMNYKDSATGVREIGKKLGARYVLEGSFRRTGERVRVSAQLISTRDQTHLWAETYDEERLLSDVFGIQSEIAEKVAHSLALKLLPAERARLRSRRTVNPEAYEDYLRGRYFWNRRSEESLARSRGYLESAIKKEPNFALAYVGLADHYNSLGFYSVLPPREAYPRAKAYALRALQIDDTLAEAHTSLADVFANYEWDWNRAEEAFHRSIQLNPSYPLAHQWYSVHLVFVGRAEQAHEEIERAYQLDPLSLPLNSDVALNYYYERQYDRAMEAVQKLLELDPNYPLAHVWLGLVFLQQARNEEAIAEFRKAQAIPQGSLMALALLGCAYGKAGRGNEARAILSQLQDLARKRYVSAAFIGLVYIGLGDQDQSFVWMERAFQERSPLMVRLKVEPLLDGLRADPRFQDLLRRMNLSP